eukprot:m.47117 g.47117  ORF g.47117 m.47117 type:complete len:514 (-) comp10959_c1_seq2:1367-2908(-)
MEPVAKRPCQVQDELSAELDAVVNQFVSTGKPLYIENYINGNFTKPEKYMDSFNPATGQVHCKVPDSQAEDVNAAVAAADAAFANWSSTSRQQRSTLLNRIADAIEANLDIFALAESRDQGKPLWLAKKVDIPRAVYNFRFFAGAILYHTERSTTLDEQGSVNFTIRTPLGVAGLITPWNLPLYLLTWKVAPALATGNTIVAKPSEMTSLTAYLLARVMAKLEVPAGVCNFVFGTGPNVGAPLVEHPRVPLISFTGGTVTGKRISQLAAPQHKKLSLELGGKNPAIIFGDVDVDHVVSETIRSSFTNQGEICLCTSRIYVHSSIFDEFLEKLVAAARAMTVGDPLQDGTRVGALVSKEHLAKVQSYVDIAREEGGTVRCGYGVDDLDVPASNTNGYFMRPTVISQLEDTSRCVMEEIFGPVIVVLPFTETDDVVARANSTDYGLSAVIWSKDGSRAHHVAERIHAGTVWINCWMVRDLRMPFGGVKGSGTGRESAVESIEYFTEVKTVCTKYA